MTTREENIALAKTVAKQEGIREGLFLGLIAQESSFRSDANSGEAYGIGQFTATTAPRWGLKPEDRGDPTKALPASARYLKHLLEEFHGNEQMAVAAYNCGEGSEKNNNGVHGAIEKARNAGDVSKWKDYLLPETRKHVVDVFGKMALYGGTNGDYQSAASFAEATDTDAGRAYAARNSKKAKSGKSKDQAGNEEDQEDNRSYISDLMRDDPVTGFLYLVFAMILGGLNPEDTENLFSTFNGLPKEKRDEAVRSLPNEERRTLETYQQAFSQAANAPIAEGAITAKDGSPPKAFIMHHTGGRGTVQGVAATLKARGLGVQYVMDRDGKIYQIGGPGESHIRPGEGQLGAGLNNSNVVGMEIIAKDDADITPQQIEAAKEFIRKNYPNTPVIGHGEINSHKQETEGKTVAMAIRAERSANGITNPNINTLAASLRASGVGHDDHDHDHHNHDVTEKPLKVDGVKIADLPEKVRAAVAKLDLKPDGIITADEAKQADAPTFASLRGVLSNFAGANIANDDIGTGNLFAALKKLSPKPEAAPARA